MPVFQYVVLSRAADGRQEEFHAWYDAQHLADGAKVPGVRRAKRYRILYGVGSSAEGSPKEDAPYDSLAIYEIEADDPVAVARELSGRAGSADMPLTDALDRWASVKYMAETAGEHPPPAGRAQAARAQASGRVRLPPLEDHEWSPSLLAGLPAWGLAPGEAPRNPSTVRATIARHEKLFLKWDPFGAAMFNGEMPDRDREVLILRVAWRLQCKPEWAYHEGPARRAGITAADIDAIVDGADSPRLSERDRLLVRVVDQLHETGTMDEETWDALAARYTREQLVEIPMIVGQYTMVAYAVNSFGTPVPDGAAPLPPRG